MKCRMRVHTGAGVIVYSAIGNPAELEAAAFDAGALGVTVMVLA